MNRLRKIFVLLLTVACLAAPSLYAQNAAHKWEPSKNMPENMKRILSQEDIQIFTAPSTISITVNQPVNVKLFTILGKLVSSQNLEPGTYEYKLNTHGIYIIKTAETTCKVAI